MAKVTYGPAVVQVLAQKPAKTFQDDADNILYNTEGCEQNWRSMGRQVSWQPKATREKGGVASEEVCHYQLSFLKKKLPSLATGRTVRVTISYQLWLKKKKKEERSHHSLQLRRVFTRNDENKRELFGILLSPLMA